MTPSNNPDYSLIGTGEFSFCEAAKTPAQALVLGYKDIGNIKTFNLDPGGDAKKHKGSYRGVVRTDRTRKTGLELAYKLTADEYGVLAMRLMFMGTSTGVQSAQAALAAAAGSAITFSAQAPSKSDRWYDLLNAGGSRVLSLTGATFVGKTEGTDFEVDYRLGRVRFMTAQTAALTPTLTAGAIVAGGVGSMNQINPMTVGTLSGMARLHVFDEDNFNNLVFSHVDFGCDISLESATDVKSDDWNDYSVMVSLTNPPGTVWHRNY